MPEPVCPNSKITLPKCLIEHVWENYICVEQTEIYLTLVLMIYVDMLYKTKCNQKCQWSECGKCRVFKPCQGLKQLNSPRAAHLDSLF